MADDFWKRTYDYLAAPARERAAREDAMKNAPTYADVLGMTQTSGTVGIGKTDRFSTEPQKLKSYFSGTPDQIVPKNTQRWTSDSFSPAMTATERVLLARQLEQSMVNGFPSPAGPKAQPLTIQVNGGSKSAYAPWGAKSRGLFFTAMNTPRAADPMTVAANQAAADFLTNPPDFRGRDKGNAPLMTYGPETPTNPAVSAVEKALIARTGPTGVGRNGYTYLNGQNMGFSAEEQAKRVLQGKLLAAANQKNPNPTYTVSGDNNAFQPRSVQESARWQTGY